MFTACGYDQTFDNNQPLLAHMIGIKSLSRWLSNIYLHALEMGMICNPYQQ